MNIRYMAMTAVAALCLVESCTVRINKEKLNDELVDKAAHVIMAGRGEEKTVSHELQVFDKVNVQGSLKVQYYVGEPKAEITAPSDLQEFILVEQDGDEVTVCLEDHVSIASEVPVLVTLYSNSLSAVSLAGSGEVMVDEQKGESFEISLAGSGDIQVIMAEAKSMDVSIAGSGDVELQDVDADDLKLSIAGSGDLNVIGTAASVNAKIAGSGDIDLSSLECENVSIVAMGSGKVIR